MGCLLIENRRGLLVDTRTRMRRAKRSALPNRAADDFAGGELAFGAVQIDPQCEYSTPSNWIKFRVSDEMTEFTVDGDAEREETGALNGEIRFYTETKFI